MRAQILILKSGVENKKKLPEFTAPEFELMFAHRESGWLSTISPHARFDLSKHQRRKNYGLPNIREEMLRFRSETRFSFEIRLCVEIRPCLEIQSCLEILFCSEIRHCLNFL